MKQKFQIKKHYIVTLMLMLYDIVAVVASYFLALWVRFDCRYSAIDEVYLVAYIKFIPYYAIICIIVFYLLRTYQSIWRFVSYSELLRVIVATIITGALHAILITFCIRRMPLSYYAFGICFQFLFIVGARFAYRFVLLERDRIRKYEDIPLSRVMLIGGGAAGHTLMRDLVHTDKANDKVCCIIDDDRNKWGRYIDGVPIVGGRDDILAAAEKFKVDKIYLAIPSMSAVERRDILNICNETGCKLMNLPGMYQFVTGEISVQAMKNVAIEDLLGRDAIKVDMNEIFQYIQGKRVLITGGGGSIGSELCRQIAAHGPAQLIIFDVYENNAYDIQQELVKKYPNLNLEVQIGSVRDSRRLQQLFGKYKPEIVYHAAAHKHVPLMEDSPCEAIKNNTIGTYKTAYAAVMNGCKRFVLISTDKAVNPTNIMGASKRLCEMVVQTFDKLIKSGRADEIPALFEHSSDVEGDILEKAELPKNIETEFVAVRFGNVLGSNGSVVPLFKKQIMAGGPVTVTHPDIIRYFMTIPEAVSLVLQAGTYAHGGEIFVLDMGEPVKIDTLARNLIKLSGFKPDVDIKVEYTGLRPGEKLYEEKLMAEEGMKTTPNKQIHIGKPLEFDAEDFINNMRELMEISYNNDESIRDKVADIVKTYKVKKQ